MKIGVVSDTHIVNAKDLPVEFLHALGGVDLILHAGDIIDLSVIEALKKLGPQVKAVWGNMDPPNLKKVLPEKELIKAGKFQIGLTHGSGAPCNLMDTVKDVFKNQRLDCIVYGHSHVPQNVVRQGILYFNPGSLTDKFFAPYNSYGVLEVDNKRIEGKIIKLGS
ncbi:MAG: metallophosphoesterase family protein [Candidatus Omnitrophica bacterium]|nr:metallophosphoesterase family protein [Candidatus Omnitrophota bacterium]